MKGLLLSALIVLALGQTIPPSSNPPSTSYFAPSVVRTLNFGEKVSSTIYNQTGYQDHYQIFIPSWVKSIRYTLNNTDQTVFTYLEMQISAPDGDNYDVSLAYPCSESSAPAACDDYDWYLYSYTGYSDYLELRAGDDFLPGTYQWITVFSYYEVGLTYELLVEAVSTCDQNDVVSVDYSDAECIPSQNIHSVPYSGFTFSGISTLEDPQYFKVSVPKNTIRIYALMTSSESYIDFLYAGAFVPASFYEAWDYASYGTYNNDGTYSFYLEIPQPQYDLPFYFSVLPYYSDNLGFTVQFFWDDCGNDFAGYGQINVDYSVPSVSFSIPDCSDPVVATVEANNYSPITFNLPAYDSAVDRWYAAAYATLKVPSETAGYRNFTCTASVDNIFVIFSKEKTADCTGEYYWYKYCDGPTTTYYQNLLLLSEDLFTGGDWSIGACNSNSQPVTVTLYSSGQIYAEPTPSPSSTPSGSSTPSSIPSASASPDSDSPSDGPQPPAGVYVLFLVIGFLLGVIVGLILGIYLFNKVSARKQASMSYVPLQPYAMPWNAMPVQMPMYNPEN